MLASSGDLNGVEGGKLAVVTLLKMTGSVIGSKL